MEFDFKPNFDVSWDSPSTTASTASSAASQSPVKPQNPQPQQQNIPQQQPKTVIETFDVDNAFVGFKPSFQTTVEKTEAKMPEEVPPIESLEGTVAAQIFGAYCQNKFGFTLALNKA